MFETPTRPRFSTLRRALAPTLVLGLGAAAVAAAPAGADVPQATKAYLEVPANRAFTAGNYRFASSAVSMTGTDTGVVVTLNVGAADDFVLTLAPRTGTTFAATNPTESATAATASAGAAQLTLTRPGAVCTNPTGSFTLDSANFSGGTLQSAALRFTVTCSEDSGTSASGFAFWQQPLGPIGAVQAGEFTPISPDRMLDTRQSTKLGPTDTRTVNVSGDFQVPQTALAVVVNLTAVDPDTDTFLSLYPAGSPRAQVSNLNPRAHDTVANLATVKVGTGFGITVYNEAGNTDVLIDVVGYYLPDNTGPGGDRFVAQTPVRKLDTRVAPSTALGEGETRSVDLGVTAHAAIVTVTVTGPTKGGYLTLFGDAATTVPLASNLNFAAGQTVANLAVVPLDAGKMKIYNPAGTTDVVIDLVGTFVTDAANADGAGRFVAIDPVRAYDSRSDATPVAAATTRAINLLARTGRYPSEYQTVVANATATNTSATSYLTAFPASETNPPFASNLSWSAGETRAGQLVAGTDADGFTGFYNAAGSTDVIVDVAGYFTQ